MSHKTLPIHVDESDLPYAFFIRPRANEDGNWQGVQPIGKGAYEAVLTRLATLIGQIQNSTSIDQAHANETLSALAYLTAHWVPFERHSWGALYLLLLKARRELARRINGDAFKERMSTGLDMYMLIGAYSPSDALQLYTQWSAGEYDTAFYANKYVRRYSRGSRITRDFRRLLRWLTPSNEPELGGVWPYTAGGTYDPSLRVSKLVEDARIMANELHQSHVCVMSCKAHEPTLRPIREMSAPEKFSQPIPHRISLYVGFGSDNTTACENAKTEVTDYAQYYEIIETNYPCEAANVFDFSIDK